MQTKHIIATAFAVTTVALAAPPSYFPDEQQIQHAAGKHKQKRIGKALSPRMVSFVESLSNCSAAEKRAKALEQGHIVRNNGSIVLHARGNISSLDASVASAGGRITHRYGDTVEFEIPLGTIAMLDGIAGIRVEAPLRPEELAITGEEIISNGVTNLHIKGSRGSGVKAAVIDGGFIGLASAQGAGEVPASAVNVDFSGAGMETGTTHGTAVAEVVYEAAPDATLYLMKIETSAQLGTAKNYCKANGINIVNHSMGWLNTEFGRGDGPISAIVNDAAANGILWVNSAGNYARGHWQGMFADTDADYVHEFSGTTGEINQLGTVSSGTSIRLYLCWDDTWGGSANDYDLELYYWTGSAWSNVALSWNIQNGDDYPVESISYTAAATGTYGCIIGKYSGVAKNLRLIATAQNLQYSVKAGSIVAPACATGALSVGAIDASNWMSGPSAWYSSQGPTADGRIKPDISGYSYMTNWTYGKFAGTSSASPSIAGHAAVIWGAYLGSYTATDVRNHLISNAVDMGTAGVDNEFGCGKVTNLSFAISGTPVTPVASTAIAASNTVHFSWSKGSLINAGVVYLLEVSSNKIDTLVITNLSSNRHSFTGIDGKYYYTRVRASNDWGAGAWTAWSGGCVVDMSPPAYTSLSGTSAATNSTLYGISINGTNDIGSGILYTVCFVSNSAIMVTNPPANALNGVYVSAFTSRTTNIGVYLLDGAMNSSVTQYISVAHVDTQAPTFSLSGGIATNGTLYGLLLNGLGDFGYGVMNTVCFVSNGGISITNGPANIINGPFIQLVTSTTNIGVYALDHATNSSVTQYISISNVDKLPPTYTSLSGTPSATNGKAYGVVINGTNDLISGIDRVGLIVSNGSTPAIYPYSSLLSGLAVPGFISQYTNIGVFVIDRGDNTSSTQYIALSNADTMKPAFIYPTNFVVSTSTNVRVSATDLSLVSFTYITNGGAPVTVSASPYTNTLSLAISFNRLGSNSLMLTAIDFEGNKATQELVFTVFSMQHGLLPVPNPYRGEGDITFLNVVRDAVVNIYSVSGKLVTTLREVNTTAVWDGTDTSGRKVSPGVYFAVTMADGIKQETVRVMVTRRR
ncbi:MAG: S8 family serine peptidase [Spirochaetes bacterium]|nr:S8 family serine peptidase [Spirochaetota bacterium]